MIAYNCKRSILFLLLGFIFSTPKILAQNYGNEWIDTTKVHVKFGIGQEGVYKINYFALESYFTERQQYLSTIPLNQFRMYNMGVEIPIYIYDQNNNNKFDVFDYFEFVGHKLDGKFDTELYQDPDDQRHTLQSLVTDSNYYFVTWRSTGSGLRFKKYSNNNPPATPPKEWHISNTNLVPTEYYNDGIPILIGDKFVYLSEYTNGEGFVGTSFTANGTDLNTHTLKYKVNTPFVYPGIGNGSGEIGLIGGSALLANPLKDNHRVIFRVGPDGSNYRIVGDTTWFNRRAVKAKFKLNAADFGTNELNVSLNSTYVNNIPLSITYLSHTIINYPRYYNLGDSVKYQYVEDTSASPVNIEWSGYGNGLYSLPVVYDETNLLRISGTYEQTGKKVKYTLPALSQPGKMFLVDESKIVELFNPDGVGVRMPNFSVLQDLQRHYIMITSSALYSSPKEEVKDYMNLWSARYNVSLNLIEDLYNTFSYGIPHPLAVRHFCKYLIDNSQNNKPEYLLLLGRGYDLRFNRGAENSALLPYKSFNHIPAIGTPVSDNMYTSGLLKSGDAPAIPTGRIPANSASDIGRYLVKLRGYLNTYQSYDDWQKNVLHLAGGGSAAQAFVIKTKLGNLEEFPLGNPFAGRVYTFSKSAGQSVDVNFKTAIQSRINEGVNLVSFLGHGSTSVTDIDVGDPDQYFNEDKYPICYFNGCQVGNVCIPLPSNLAGLGEKMFRADKKGAVAFIGQTTTSELYTVSRQMEYFYKNYFDSTPNRTIGKIMQSTIDQFEVQSSPLSRLHCQNIFLTGDPALPVFLPELPDFSISNSSIFLDPPNAIALQDSFRVGVIITNLGRGVDDSFSVKLTRTFPDFTTKRFFNVKWKMKGFVDTVFFVIKSKDKAAIGDNTFQVSINDERKPVEFTYSNNLASAKFYLAANGLNLIMPTRFAIIGTDSVELMVQKSDLFKESEDFYIELDTTPWFNSPLLLSLERNNTPITAGTLAKWKVGLPSLRDTQVYFWRARINVAGNQGGNWTMRSFTYIKNHGEGWMQNLHWQFSKFVSNNEYDRIYVDSAKYSLHYTKISKKIYIDCEYQKTSNLGIKETGFGGQDMNFGVCTGSGLVVIPWDSRTLTRKPVDTSKIEPSCWAGKLWTTFGNKDDQQLYYAFQMSDPTQRADFVKFVNAMDDSMYATIYTRYQSDADKWDADVFLALNKLGIAVFDTLSYRTQDAMLVAVGKKGWKPGLAQEAYVRGGYVQLEGEMVGDAENGTIYSESIGPSNLFSQLIYYPKINQNDQQNEDDLLTIDVIGHKQDGSHDILRQNEVVTNTYITTIDTRKYHFLQLKMNSADALNRTSPNLMNWRIVHDSVPEGTLYPDSKYNFVFHDDTLYEGDTFRLDVAFKNISRTPFRDSLVYTYSLFDKITREILDQGTWKYKPLKPDSFFMIKYKHPTVGLKGPYGLQITVNSQYQQPEKTLVNNSSLINFFVTRDIMKPVLNVTFDGRHIIDGDIVSANPFILITSTDENKFLWQKDTSTFDLFFKRPNATDFEKIQFGSEALFFPAKNTQNQAKIEYRPLDLPSGTYTLKVQSRDAKQNQAGYQSYEINFNVIREQSITHFYPYPNPFTSSMRFVFTLTGTTLPEEIKIKIMTAEGRVVKELSKDDLGEIHVGNNITQWAWDGTDQYGDKLGNGTYFYKVSVKSGGEEVKLRESKGDGSFKNQVGVIYLMR